jgi:glycosyltransferase involved in cell wall biosynthesis
LLFVGHLNRGKRPDWFLGAVRSLRADGVPVTARMVGDGPMSASLRRPAAEAGVEMLGWREDVVALFQESDLLVFPSASDAEGMPGVLIEAGLCGLPVVATRVAGVSDVIEDGVTGRVVPEHDFARFVDAVKELTADPDRRRAMGAAARGRCERAFALPAVAVRWGEVLSSVASGSRPRSARHGDPEATAVKARASL